MKRLIAWLRPKNQTCPTCGGFKMPKAQRCFDCTELAQRAWGDMLE